jgi:hypothetical protein
VSALICIVLLFEKVCCVITVEYIIQVANLKTKAKLLVNNRTDELWL